MKKLLQALCLLFFAGNLYAQQEINITGGLAYSQNFDMLANTAATQCTVVDFPAPSPLPTNWLYTAVEDGRDATAAAPKWGGACDGSGVSGSVSSYGAIGATERALGSIGSGTPESQYWGIRLKNTSGATIMRINMRLTGEQWRLGNATTDGDTLAVSYQAGATVADLTTGTWTDQASCNVIGPIKTGAVAAALDGNAVANQVSVNCNILPAGGWANGQEMVIRFYDRDDIGSDNAVAIDNFTLSTYLTTAAEVAELPTGYAVSKAYPNPFSQETQFEVSLAESQRVAVTVYDLTGREVAVLHDGILDAGTQSFKVSGQGLSAGMYFYRIQGEKFYTTQAFTVIK